MGLEQPTPRSAMMAIAPVTRANTLIMAALPLQRSDMAWCMAMFSRLVAMACPMNLLSELAHENFRAHRLVPVAEVRIGAGLGECDAVGGTLAIQRCLKAIVTMVGSARGDGVQDVVLVIPGDSCSRPDLDGRGPELEGLDGDRRIPAIGLHDPSPATSAVACTTGNHRC